jgi:hypothetical protein
MRLQALRPGTARQDAQQLRHRQVRAVLRQQARGTDAAAPLAPVACHLEQGGTTGNLAEADDATWHSRLPVRFGRSRAENAACAMAHN